MPNTKQAKFKAANTGSQQAFTSKTPGASTQPCPLKKQVKIPCDIKDIVIKEHPGSAYDVQVRQEDGSYMSSSTNTDTKHANEQKQVSQGKIKAKDAKESGLRRISLKGNNSEQAPKQKELQVISGKKGAKNPTQIEIMVESDVGYHDKSKHPKVIFSGDGDRKTVVGGEAVNCKFPVWCKFDYESQDAVAQFFLEKYWPFCWDKNPFTASVEVCGARNKGSVNGSSSGSKLNVVVYPSDAFTMKLSIPPWRKTHSERAGAVTYQKDAGVVATTTTGKTQEDYRIGNGSSVSGTESGTERSLSNPSQLNLTSSKTITTDNTKLRESIETKEGVKGGKVLISEEIKLQERDVVLTFEEDTDEGKKPIVLSKEPTTGIDFEITRNGQALETAVKVRELLNTVKYLEYNIKQVFNSIKDFVPQVGWKMGLDISLFSGTLEGSWSYKEHTDHRVFMYYAIEAKLKIVEVGLDLSFGISVMGGSIQAVLIGKLEGAVEFVSNVERDSPDTQAPDKSKTGFNGSIDGSLSGQAALGYGWFKIERKAGISFGVEIFGGLKIEEKEGFYLEGNGKFKPIKFFAYCDDGINGKSGKEYILTEEKDLFSGRFPEGKTSSSVPTTNKVPTVKTAPPSGRSARVTKPKKP